MSKIKMWFIRTFKVITIKEAESLGLSWNRNIYGDEINHLECRSLWVDSNDKVYRVDELLKNGREINTYKVCIMCEGVSGYINPDGLSSHPCEYCKGNGVIKN